MPPPAHQPLPLPPGERSGEGAVPPSPVRPKSAAAKAKPSANQTRRAQRLRRDMTDAERLVWSHLRAGKYGAKFRRQEPILGYTVDFVCHRLRLVIEIDGAQHDADRDRDARRTAALDTAGYRVIRFWNGDVFTAFEGVMDAIWHEVQAGLRRCPGGDTPSPDLSPGGRGIDGVRPADIGPGPFQARQPAQPIRLPPGEREGPAMRGGEGVVPPSPAGRGTGP